MCVETKKSNVIWSLIAKNKIVYCNFCVDDSNSEYWDVLPDHLRLHLSLLWLSLLSLSSVPRPPPQVGPVISILIVPSQCVFTSSALQSHRKLAIDALPSDLTVTTKAALSALLQACG